jgi:hypothetical protein
MAYFFVNEAGNRECEGRDEKSAAAPEYTKDDESKTILHHIPFWSALTGLAHKTPENEELSGEETLARSGEEDADDGTSIPPPRFPSRIFGYLSNRTEDKNLLRFAQTEAHP